MAFTCIPIYLQTECGARIGKRQRKRERDKKECGLKGKLIITRPFLF